MLGNVRGAMDEGNKEPLYLLEKWTTGQDTNNIKRKERMRVIGLQRLVANCLLAERRAA